MSGITPIIDTLLPQVLGKRADFPPPRELNQPVRPISPGDALKAVHSDSRLDARQTSPLLDPSGKLAHRDAARSPPVPLPEPSSQASTRTHFSASARTIAEVLSRFPAPPSVIKPPLPLMTPDQSASPEQVARLLQSSVRDSGLFYESHLARWYRGAMTRQQLEAEPQMLRRPVAAPPAPAGGAPVAADAAQSASAERLEAPFQAVEAGASRALAAGGATASLDEALQGIVRHQLEMLVTPVLRWEGDIWSGLFLSLVMQLPQERGETPSREGGDEREQGGGEDAWQSRLSLRVAGLGDLEARLSLRGDRLELALASSQEDTVRRLDDERGDLQSRLEGCGFTDVRLKVTLSTPEEEER